MTSLINRRLKKDHFVIETFSKHYKCHVNVSLMNTSINEHLAPVK